MTLEAWVLPSTNLGWRTILFKEQANNVGYSLYSSSNTNVPRSEAVLGGTARSVNGPSAITTGVWTHLAASYDGSTYRLFVNGTQVATTATSGNIAVTTGVLRLGGNNVDGEFYSGKIDEVRVYNRALTQAEIQSDMNRPVTPDFTPPTVAATTPAAGAVDVPIGVQPTARFNELMDPAIGGRLRAPRRVQHARPRDGDVRRCHVDGDARADGSAHLRRHLHRDGQGRPSRRQGRLRQPSRHRPRLELLDGIDPAADPRDRLDDEQVHDVCDGDPARRRPERLLDARHLAGVAHSLGYYDVVVLGDMALTPIQVTTLTNWVNGGGNLIALRPDKQLAGLLGLTDAGTTLTNTYLAVNTATEAGAGIVGQTIQFHGTADRYTLNGATSIATLYTNASTATTSPAVTLRSVGSNGGQAAAFAYDLNRSIVYTRQGNPAWAGQDRDGVGDLRPNDMFYGAAAGDSKPDWVDTNKIGIPQGDEQQRLLANLIVLMNRDRTPLPRFWYLPRDEKAALVMTGDDHATGGTAGRFNTYIADSPPGCSVANWDCVRSTSYVYANSPLTNAQASSYVGQGFEVALHPSIDNSCKPWPTGELDSLYFTPQLSAFAAKYTSVPAPVTSRTHCVEWTDWATEPKVELAHGIRLDTNYYHYPSTLDRQQAGLHDRIGHDHALRRPRRLADRRVPGAHPHDGRVEHGSAGFRQLPARPRDRARGLLRHVRLAQSHRHRGGPELGRDHRLCSGAERAGDLGEAGADMGGCAQQVRVPRLQLERKRASVPDFGGRRSQRPSGDAAGERDRQGLDRTESLRHPRRILGAADQGY